VDGPPVGAYVLGGLGIVALGAALYFKLALDSDVDSLRGTCAPNCSQISRDAVSAKLESMNVSLTAGVLALGGALTWAWLGSRRGVSASIGVRPASSGGLVQVAGAF
jgi:hypothetical protein